ncbi:putative glutathione S-transferase [Eremomyces bilateralis CBS 781.70]|uniref:Glutathione S-transferase n=1 Tax=Eremomyces bilateralis CBS 781.70 TaxID=1392243 RepID=A0A6G1GB36_9PEZI|nr:putative glutathione S-transferase [Eremomyces bilateralis CBS 781.70]KAF1815234.1 putative glutathione S-transferase [Eremomyces bilateralis CBS 781.70]
MDGNSQQKTIPTVYNMSSSKAREVLWALEEIADAGIKYNIVNLPRRGADTTKVLKSHFPLGKSPTVTLEHVDGEAEVTYQIIPNVLTETRLILQFISDHYTDGIWIPESEEDKARDTFFQEFANGSLLAKVNFIVTFEVIPAMLFFPLRQLTLLMVLPIRLHFMNDLTISYQILDDALSEERPWFSGKKLGLADLNMIFPMDQAVGGGYIKLEKYPKLAKWHDTVINRPAYKRALEKGGPYDLATYA